MGMGLTCGEDRFVFEKRFSKKEVLFEDITEITIEDKIFRIMTRSGKELQAKMGVFAFRVPDEVFDVIRKHNIAFRDMDCLSESTKIVIVFPLNLKVSNAKVMERTEHFILQSLL